MFELAGLGLGLIGGIGKMIGRGKANKKLNTLQTQDPTYKANPLAGDRLSLANTLLNARMPGAARAERNIYASGGNARGQVQRNATDSSQALALGASIQGQEGNQFGQLADQEAQDYQRRYSNQVGAQQGMINEGDKVFQDEQRRWGDKMQIQGAINENKQNSWGDLANMGFGLASFGMAGGMDGMGGMFGGGNKGMAGQQRTGFAPQNSVSWGNPTPQSSGGINPAYMPYIGGGNPSTAFNPYTNKALNG